MEVLKDKLEELKTRILTGATVPEDVDIINNAWSVIEQLKEIQPEMALDESAEAMSGTSGLYIYNSEINITVLDREISLDNLEENLSLDDEKAKPNEK